MQASNCPQIDMVAEITKFLEILKYLEDQNLIYDRQYSFHSQRPTADLLTTNVTLEKHRTVLYRDIHGCNEHR